MLEVNMISAVSCKDFGFILRILGYLFGLLQWVIPILLIILITVDLFKIVTGSADEKAKKEGMNRIVKRIIYAVIIFLIPIMVKMIFGVVGRAHVNDATSWVSCFNAYFK